MCKTVLSDYSVQQGWTALKNALLVLLVMASLLFFNFAYAEGNPVKTQTQDTPQAETLKPDLSESGVSDKELLASITAMEKKSADNLAMAVNIINWSAMFFGLLAVFLLIAGAVGIKEFSSIRVLEKSLRETHKEMQNELAQMQANKVELLAKVRKLDADFKNNNKKLMQMAYLMNEGVGNLREGNADQAIENFKWMLKKNPDDYDTLCYLARAYGLTGRFVLAEFHARKAIVNDGDKHLAYYILGEILRIQKKYAEAIPHLKKAMELNLITNTLNGLAYAFLKSGDYSEAIDIFKESIQRGDRHSANSGIAKAYLLSGQQTLAEHHFTKAKALATQSIKRGSNSYGLAYFNVAFADMFFGDEKSLESLEKAVRKTKNAGVISEQLVDYEAISKQGAVSGKLLDQSILILREKLESLQVGRG